MFEALQGMLGWMETNEFSSNETRVNINRKYYIFNLNSLLFIVERIKLKNHSKINLIILAFGKKATKHKGLNFVSHSDGVLAA